MYLTLSLPEDAIGVHVSFCPIVPYDANGVRTKSKNRLGWAWKQGRLDLGRWQHCLRRLNNNEPLGSERVKEVKLKLNKIIRK